MSAESVKSKWTERMQFYVHFKSVIYFTACDTTEPNFHEKKTREKKNLQFQKCPCEMKTKWQTQKWCKIEIKFIYLFDQV